MLKTWEDVKRDLDLVKENKNKSILLGNGFTIPQNHYTVTFQNYNY